MALICGPLPTCEFAAVLMEYYSRWPETKMLKSVTSNTALDWIDRIFATHSYLIKTEIKTDTALHFVSIEVRDALKAWGAHCKTVPEYGQQANGQVERLNKGFEK